MIDKKKVDFICSEAYSYASVLDQEYFSSLDITKNYHGKTAASPILAALAQFALDTANCHLAHIQFTPNGFGSWLFADGDSYTIVMNPHQMQHWFQMDGMLIHTQIVRAVIHEIGHVVLSAKVVEEADGRRGRARALGQGSVKNGIASVEPGEEEKAWVFTWMVLGIVLGSYSRRRREGVPEDDNTIIAHV